MWRISLCCQPQSILMMKNLEANLLNTVHHIAHIFKHGYLNAITKYLRNKEAAHFFMLPATIHSNDEKPEAKLLNTPYCTGCALANRHARQGDQNVCVASKTTNE